MYVDWYFHFISTSKFSHQNSCAHVHASPVTGSMETRSAHAQITYIFERCHIAHLFDLAMETVQFVETVDPPGTSSSEKKMPKETFEPPPLLRAVTTYVGYLILYVVSLVSDFLRRVGLKKTGHVEVTKKEVQTIYRTTVCCNGVSALFVAAAKE